MLPAGRLLVATLRTRSWILCAAGAVALGAAGGALPLLEVPGLELGLVAAIAASVLVAPLVGFWAARRADPRGPGPAPVLVPFAVTVGGTLAVLALLFTASAIRAAVATPCRPWGAPALFGVVAAPSAILSSGVAVTTAVLARGRRGRAALLHAMVVAASLATTAAIVYLGPAAFAHDHVLGVWPGPIYDEVIPIDRRLLLFRVGTLAWTGVALSIGAIVARRRVRVEARVATSGLALSAIAVLLAWWAGGGTPTRRELASRLGAVRVGPRCIVHLAAERGQEEAERALLDCEYDAAAVARALGLADPPRATVWIYRSPEEKRRLVGASRTSYTKPWLAEIHVHDQGVPHPVLRHELVHALASAAARGPLRVPARAVVGVDLGLVEGLAVAVDVPSDEYGVHGWARAMRDEGRLPPLRALLATGGFFSEPASRAYVASGSFLRFLLERRGAPTVLAVYREDDLPRATGESVARLEEAWHRFLDGIEVPPALATAAEARFERGSLFARACAREVATLEHDAAAASARGRADRAEALLRRASALSGGDPAPLRGAAEAWAAIGDLPHAETIAREALGVADAAGARLALRGSLASLLGDLELRAGDPDAAAARYHQALALSPDRAEARGLVARLTTTRDPILARATVPWLLSTGDRAVAMARLAESDAPLARYLLARAELARGAPADALRVLSTLRAGTLPDPAFEEEARRLRAEALCRARRWDEGIAAWEAVARATPRAGTRAQADDAALRCAFDRDARRRDRDR